jgi:hypothetical protein
MKTNTIIIALCILSQTLFGQSMSIKSNDTAYPNTTQTALLEPRQNLFPDPYKLEAEWGFYVVGFEKFIDLQEDFLCVKSPFKDVKNSPVAHSKPDNKRDIAYKLKLIEWQKSMPNTLIWEE